MNSSFDTLNITPLRRGTERPLAGTAAANHPDAAAEARARIEAIHAQQATSLQALPPARLETDKARLAAQVAATKPALAVRHKAAGRRMPSATKPFFTAIGVFVMLLVLMKSPVIFSQLQYAVNKPAPQAAVQASATAVIPGEPTISIPKISVYAPVVYEPSIAEGNVQKALESGVVHYGNTPLPGQPGNSVIFGHSSNDWWEPGNYKFIFGLLDKLSLGDRFSVDYQSKRYIYEVSNIRVVAPTDVSVLNPTAEPTLTLITCTPPGTSLKRLVVSAKQVDPVPGAQMAAKSSEPAVKAALPGAPVGFLDQAGKAVSGIFSGIASLFGIGGESGAPASTASPVPASGTIPSSK